MTIEWSNIHIHIYIYIYIERERERERETERQRDREMEKAMVPHSSTLAWRIPWTKEPGGLQSMGSQRVGND